jgi:hypothetical protein
VPIVAVETTPAPGDTTGRLVTRAKIVVESEWLRESIQSGRSVFDQHQTLVEIGVHGPYIVDCNGQIIAATVKGLTAGPAEESAPGCDFFSSFRVSRAPPRAARRARENDVRNEGAMS